METVIIVIKYWRKIKNKKYTTESTFKAAITKNQYYQRIIKTQCQRGENHWILNELRNHIFGNTSPSGLCDLEWMERPYESMWVNQRSTKILFGNIYHLLFILKTTIEEGSRKYRKNINKMLRKIDLNF